MQLEILAGTIYVFLRNWIIDIVVSRTVLTGTVELVHRAQSAKTTHISSRYPGKYRSYIVKICKPI